jgi:hypothetical protein
VRPTKAKNFDRFRGTVTAMSADLHLRALREPSLAPLLRDWGRGNIAEWDALPRADDDSPNADQLREEAWDALSDRDEQLEQMATELGIWDGPNVWLGQVSWSKAGLFADEDGSWRRWVPRCVEAIQRFYDAHGGIVAMTPGVRSAVTTAFSLPHDSWYETGKSRGVAKARDVKKWCDQHMGDLTFVMSE